MKKATIGLMLLVLVIVVACSPTQTPPATSNGVTQPIGQELNDYETLGNDLDNSDLETLEQDLDLSDL